MVKKHCLRATIVYYQISWSFCCLLLFFVDSTTVFALIPVIVRVVNVGAMERGIDPACYVHVVLCQSFFAIVEFQVIVF